MLQIIESPVLLITFNRADNTRKVFEKLREANVSKLYVFNDGSRKNNAADVKAREEIKNMLGEIDWNCELYTNFSNTNLGCGHGPSSAITWAFENEEQLIILEDDCVPAISFFDYCNELLELYKNDNRVWMISGNNYNEEYQFDSSYTFSKNAIHIWGWATWKRSWSKYDFEMKLWDSFYNGGGFKNIFAFDKEVAFWTKRYVDFYAEPVKTTWDYQFVLDVFMNGGLAIVPAKNLVGNIGYDGVHTGEKIAQHDKVVDNAFKVVKHPHTVLGNRGYDVHHLTNHWAKKKSLITRVRRKVISMVSKKVAAL